MDHRGDIYSVGVLIFEMLTGRTPFAGNSSMDILLAHATENPPSFADVGAADVVPPAVEKVVQSCLAKDPSQRPASARDLAELYERALAGDEIAKKPKKVEPPPTEVMPSPIPNLLPKDDDPNAVTFQLAAWMPETIAAHKLRGFVYDAKGEVVESVPGRIRVRLGGAGSKYQFKPRRRSWMILGRRSGKIEMDLHMVQAAPDRASQLLMTVQMRSVDGVPASDDSLRDFCSHIFVSLRGYLMAQTIGAEENNQ
jgi:serine/threonine-protein kinase